MKVDKIGDGYHKINDSHLVVHIYSVLPSFERGYKCTTTCTVQLINIIDIIYSVAFSNNKCKKHVSFLDDLYFCRQVYFSFSYIALGPC